MYVYVHEKKIQLQPYYKEGDIQYSDSEILFLLEEILALKVAQEYVYVLGVGNSLICQ